MEIVIASDQDRENLFAEIQVEGQPWLEVIYDEKKQAYMVTLFPPGDGEEWPVFDLAELRRALGDAKEALVQRGYPDLSV